MNLVKPVLISRIQIVFTRSCHPLGPVNVLAILNELPNTVDISGTAHSVSASNNKSRSKTDQLSSV